MRLNYGGKTTETLETTPAPADSGPAAPSGRGSVLGMLAEKLIQGRNNQRLLQAQQTAFNQTGIIPT